MLEWLILIAYLLDLWWGDPRWLPHPVVIIGKAISFLEKMIRNVCKNKKALRFGGGILFLLIVGGTYGVTWGILYLAKQYLGEYSMIAYWVLSTLLIYTTLSTKSLAEAAYQVANPLLEGNLVEARKYLGWIVGRDTENLDESEITRGVVETIAENTVDGIISPLFYAFIGGAPLAMTYKAINTLDSMVGYKDEHFLEIGCVSAILDDWANYIPARITGVLMLISSFVLNYDAGNGLRIMKRDAKKHPSPNGGIPESITAGSLHIRLGGYNSYYGKKSFREYMGDNEDKLCFVHINKTVKLMRVTSLFGVMTGIIVLYVVHMGL